MKQIGLTLVLGGLLGAAAGLTTPAQAMPPSLSGQLGIVSTNLSPIEKAQFFFGGRNYCFYLNGWNGPGFYWCGYEYRRGFGYGGPVGWHGWRGGGGHRGGPMRGGPRRGGMPHGGMPHGGRPGGGHGGGGHPGGGHGGGGHGGGGHGGGGRGHR